MVPPIFSQLALVGLSPVDECVVGPNRVGFGEQNIAESIHGLVRFRIPLNAQAADTDLHCLSFACRFRFTPYYTQHGQAVHMFTTHIMPQPYTTQRVKFFQKVGGHFGECNCVISLYYITSYDDFAAGAQIALSLYTVRV